MHLRTTLGLAVFGFAGAVAFGNPFYTLNSFGNVQRWDSPASPTLVGQFPGVSNPEGLAIAPDGSMYVMGWQSTSLERLDPVTHQVTNLGPLQPPTLQSFFKDLAWDPTSNRLIGLHWSNDNGSQWTRNFLVSIDVSTMQASVLGEIAGLNPAGGTEEPALGLAIDALGRRFIQFNSQVYQLGGANNLVAQPLPFPMSTGTAFNGLGIDPATGTMLATGGGIVWTVAQDGSALPLASGGDFRDVAFEVPAPGGAAISTGLCLSFARLRKRKLTVG